MVSMHWVKPICAPSFLKSFRSTAFNFESESEMVLLFSMRLCSLYKERKKNSKAVVGFQPAVIPGGVLHIQSH